VSAGGRPGSSPVDVDALITRLHLQPHPEGGWFRQTWLGPTGPDGRPTGTAILYVLIAGQRSHWHRLDIDEVWHFNDGEPMEHRQVLDDGSIQVQTLGPCAGADGSVPQVVVPAGRWQAARPLGAWSAAGCSTAPGFTVAGFELAPPGWEPGTNRSQPSHTT
jgi:predicted cupin superfamily sugar epimerase